jgi:signal transduction histidine kinase/ActR/RegA family two-component response regulator
MTARHDTVQSIGAAGTPPGTPRPQGSLRLKVLLVVMTATAAALLLSAGAMLFYEFRSYRTTWVSDLSSQADLLAQSVAPTLTFDDRKAAGLALTALKLRPQIRVAAVFDAQRALFASYRLDGEPRALPAAPAADGAVFRGDVLELTRSITQDGEPLGTIYLQASYDVAGRVVDYAWILGLSSLAGLGLALLIYRQLHPAITRPILAVAEVSRRVMEEGNYDLRVTTTSDDEVGVLVDAFNRMLHNLSAEMKERQDAEEALRAADRRKDEFLATLAHELRNPLAPLGNALAILQRADGDATIRQSTLAMMQRQFAQLVRLIDDLLEVSRISQGKLDLRRQAVDLVEVARGAAEAAGPVMQKHGHRVAMELPRDAMWVDADAARLQQVFVNLLHNAAKFTRPGGDIRISLEPRPGAVVARVEDNGIGIALDRQAAIFDMFVQLDKSLERGAAGLGVGLTIAKQLVELHGGTISVRSAGPGTGSTFEVMLPAIAAPAARSVRSVPPVASVAPAPTASPAPDGGAATSGRTVLVADDNIDFANSLADLLRREGHVVRVVHDGQAALQAAAESLPDAAFLDIGMPVVNGYELAARLRRHHPAAPLLLVAVTGWGQEADRRRVREAGFDHHLVKPIDLRDALMLLAEPSQAALVGRPMRQRE